MAFKFNPFTGKLDIAGSGGGAGTVTSVTGTSPIASSGGATPAISIANAAADGATKGAAAFNASDFEATAGVVSIDYTNGQAASASAKGFLTSTDWTTFNSKGAGTVTSVTATSPITSSGGANPVISTSMATNKLLGRSTAATGVAEEITVGTGLVLSAGTLTNTATITTGSVDNAILRADGTGGATLQNSDLNIDDATVTTQANVAITNQHVGQTNSALVLTPKGTGALIAGPKPDGTVTGGNARGTNAVDLQTSRAAATQVASGIRSIIIGGVNNRSSGQFSIASGDTCTSTNYASIAFGQLTEALGDGSGAIGGIVNKASGRCSGILAGERAIADRHGMQAHSVGRFSADGDAQRARFVLRCKTTTNTGVEMALDGATTYLGITSGKVISMTINISGVKSDGAAVAHYVRQYAVKNVTGTSTQVYAPVTIGSDNAAGTVIALSANDADDTLRILVTGIASETWRWVASVDAVEIAYGT